MLSVAVANMAVACAPNEFCHFNSPSGTSCGAYMTTFINSSGGYLADPKAVGECSYCSYDNTNQILAQIGCSYEHRWRNFGLLWVFIVFNAVAAVVLYWLCRVPKKMKTKTKKAMKE